MQPSTLPTILKLLTPFSRLAVKFHISVILIGTLASGWVFTTLLLFAGVQAIPVRYFLSVLGAYGIFILLSTLWLKYFGRRTKLAGQKRSVNTFDKLNTLGDALDFIPESSRSLGEWGKGGGGFSGAGASGSFDGVEIKEWSTHSDVISMPDLSDVSNDADDIWGTFIAFLLITIGLSLFLWGGYYLIEIPLLFVEGLFHGILTAALVGAAKKMDDHDWAGSIFKQTRWIAACILALTLACGYALTYKCPTARKMTDALSCPVP